MAAVVDRVTLPWLGSARGHCAYCVSRNETLCEAQAKTGYSIDGGYAHYVVADGRYVVPVPADVNAVFDEILTGRVPARVVIEY